MRLYCVYPRCYIMKDKKWIECWVKFAIHKERYQLHLRQSTEWVEATEHNSNKMADKWQHEKQPQRRVKTVCLPRCMKNRANNASWHNCLYFCLFYPSLGRTESWGGILILQSPQGIVEISDFGPSKDPWHGSERWDDSQLVESWNWELITLYPHPTSLQSISVIQGCGCNRKYNRGDRPTLGILLKELTLKFCNWVLVLILDFADKENNS